MNQEDRHKFQNDNFTKLPTEIMSQNQGKFGWKYCPLFCMISFHVKRNKVNKLDLTVSFHHQVFLFQTICCLVLTCLPVNQNRKCERCIVLLITMVMKIMVVNMVIVTFSSRPHNLITFFFFCCFFWKIKHAKKKSQCLQKNY